MSEFTKTNQYYKFCLYGFFKNLRFFDVFFLLFLRAAGMSYWEIGTLYSIRQVTINIFEIPSGLVADILGRKNSLIFAILAYLLSFAIFYRSYSFILFSSAMVAFGIGEAFRSGTHKAMILEYLKLHNLLDQKTRFYGSTRSWSQFGSAISSLLAMAIVFAGNEYRVLFLFASLPYLLDLMLLISYPAELNGQTATKRQTGRQIQISGKFKSVLGEFKSTLQDIKTLRTLFSAAAYIALFKGIKDYLQPVLKLFALALPVLLTIENEKRTAIVVGISYFIIFLLTSFTSRKAWIFEKRFKNLSRAIDSAYLVGVGSIGLAGVFLWFELTLPAVLVFIGLYIVQNLRRPLMVSYISELISTKVMASGLSAASQLETIMIVIFAPVLGWLVDLAGLSAGLIASSLLFFIFFPLVKLSSFGKRD